MLRAKVNEYDERLDIVISKTEQKFLGLLDNNSTQGDNERALSGKTSDKGINWRMEEEKDDSVSKQDKNVYIYTVSLASEDQFLLPAGAFGYSYEFDNGDTGAVVASGGTGNEDKFWRNCKAVWFNGDPWAGLYMQVVVEQDEVEGPQRKVHGHEISDAYLAPARDVDAPA